MIVNVVSGRPLAMVRKFYLETTPKALALLTTRNYTFAGDKTDRQKFKMGLGNCNRE